MTQPITYYADSPAAQSFARVYGDRLQSLSQSERLYIMLTLGLALFLPDSMISPGFNTSA
jgi:hypothetical protein